MQELRRIVAEIPFWKTDPGADDLAFLELDMERLDELAEAWIPVKTVYGPGVLVFENCD